MEKQEEFVERMIEEQKALKEKIVKLNAFIVDQKFNQLDDYNKSLLIRQREGMAFYFETLTARISLNLK